MPFHAIPLTVKFVIEGQADGQDVINVLHYKYVGAAPTAVALDAFITSWKTAHLAQWLACHSSGYLILGFECTDIASAAGARATQALSTGNVGTVGSPLLPNNVALAVSWRTGLAGRTNRGRTFMGGLPASGYNNDAITGSLLTALSTLAAALISQTFTGGFDFAVASFKDSLAKVITGFIMETVIDSMRRRLPGRGN
jgi:hypothetical protein